MSIGTFVWYDLLTTDRDTSIAFFTGLFGWSTEDHGGDKGYVGWSRGDHSFGGIETQRQPGAPSCWVGYIQVENVDGSVERIGKMGGSTLMPAMNIGGESPDSGRIAITTDPQGAIFALYQHGKNHENWSPSHEQVGDFSWAELASSDVDAAKAFYCENFNWSPGDVVDMAKMGGEGSYHMILNGEAPLGGMMPKPEMAPVSMWTHYVVVEDVDATIAKAKELGGNLLAGPINMGPVSFATLASPTGAVFGVVKPAG